MRQTLIKEQVNALLQTAYAFAWDSKILYAEEANIEEETFTMRDCDTGDLYTFLWDECLQKERSVWFTYANTGGQARLIPLITLFSE